MAPLLPHLAALSEAERQDVQDRVAEFEQSWDEVRLAAMLSTLPPFGTGLRYALLVELARADLRRRWQRGFQATVEAYLLMYPELGTAESVPAALIETEIDIRQQFGASLNQPDLLRRFPNQGELIRRWLSPKLEGSQSTGSGGHSTFNPRTGAVTQPPAGPGAAPGSLPEQFGRYRIVRELGGGGMGKVYLAEDSQLGRVVALKVPHFNTQADSDTMARFHREARVAATMHHPNICPVYDVGAIDGIHYMTMAFIEGQSLAELIQGNLQMPQGQAATLVWKVARALDEAHQKGVVHRDLKPSNIIIDRRGEPVIVDFGLARQLNQEGTRLTVSGALLGTPAYMAPEQITNDAHANSPACDIYSLGVILYQLLAGQIPYKGSVGTILGKIMVENPAPPSEYRPDLHPALEAVCLKAMARKVSDRLASMADFAAALENFRTEEVPPAGSTPLASSVRGEPMPEAEQLTDVSLAPPVAPHSPRPQGKVPANTWKGKAVQAPGPSAPRRQEPVRANRSWVAVVAVLAALLLLAAGAGGFFLLQAQLNFASLRTQEPTEIEPTIPATTPAATTPATTRPIEKPRPSYLAVQLPATAVLEVDGATHPERGDRRRIALPPLHPDEERTFKVRATWKEQGKDVSQERVVRVRSGQEIELVFKETPVTVVEDPVGEIRRLDGHKDRVWSVAYSPDGRRGLSGGDDLDLRLWDLESGKVVRTLVGHQDRVWCVAFSPDGKRALSGSDDKTVRLWDVESGKPIHVMEGHTDWVRCVAFAPNGQSAVSGSNDLTLRTWDLKTGKESGRFKGHGGPIRGVAFFPDGKRIISASDDQTLRLWEAETTQKLRDFQGHTGKVTCLAVSPDGTQVVSGSEDETIRLWNAETAREIRPFPGLGSIVASVAFTANGRRVLSGSYDKTLRVWDTSHGQTVGRLEGHTKAVTGVAASADGRRALTGSSDNTVRLWGLGKDQN